MSSALGVLIAVLLFIQVMLSTVQTFGDRVATPLSPSTNHCLLIWLKTVEAENARCGRTEGNMVAESMPGAEGEVVEVTLNKETNELTINIIPAGIYPEE